MAEKEKRKVSTKFAGILAIISIIGFSNIISETFFSFSVNPYYDSILLFLIALGFILASRPKNLYEGSKRYFTENSFTRLITFILGLISLVAAGLTIPQLNFTHHMLDMVKVIIAVIAIIFIAVQTWIVEH